MAGAGYKLFATGDVLTAAQVNTYLMQQTVMVFASSAARTSALSGVLAEGMVSYLQDTNTLEVYDGAAWVGATGDITALTAGTGISISSATGPVPTVTNAMATEITAKGDLIVGTGSATFDNLAAGSNGETLVADSSTSTGLRYQGTMAAGKNAIINGNFDIWQRGTSFASTTGYFADRWTNNGDLASVTASQQTSGAPDGSRYYLRLTSTANSSYWQNWQYMETATVSQFWGKTVVGSMKIRRNATMSSNVYLTLQKSATVDAGSGATWTTISQYTFTNANIPTGTTSADWLTATGTFVVPNDGTANSLRLTIQYVVVVPSGSVLDISQVQLELGSVPTAFTRAGGTIQGELAACQRYYIEYGGDKIFERFGGGSTDALTSGRVFTNMPVTMRTTPSMTSTITDWQLVLPGISGVALTALTLSTDESSTKIAALTATIASTAGFGSSKAVVLCTNSSTSARIRLSAEL